MILSSKRTYIDLLNFTTSVDVTIYERFRV